jgi:hypothetical protein
MDPHHGVTTDPRTLSAYAYVAADPLNKLDPSGRFFLSTAFATFSIISTLAQISSIPAHPEHHCRPIAANTELFISEGSDTWDEGAAQAGLREAAAIWANLADIYFVTTSVKRVPADPILYLVPALDDQYAAARAYVDGYARGKHVTVLVDKPRHVVKGIYDIPVAGRASLGPEANGRGYAFSTRGGRVLAHEWGHNFDVGDNEGGRDPRYLMTQGAEGLELRPGQLGRVRVNAGRWYR